MKIISTKIPDVKIIKAEKNIDDRGYFTRLLRDKEFGNYKIKEINRSYTIKKGTIRGLHMQKSPMAQDKLIQCIQGSIFDVAIDMRPDSPSYLKWVGLTLTGDEMLFVPKGFGHGFQSLENNVIVQYYVSQYYSPEHEKGIRYSDKKISIDWPIKKIYTSDKDANWPLL